MLQTKVQRTRVLQGMNQHVRLTVGPCDPAAHTGIAALLELWPHFDGLRMQKNYISGLTQYG